MTDKHVEEAREDLRKTALAIAYTDCSDSQERLDALLAMHGECVLALIDARDAEIGKLRAVIQGMAECIRMGKWRDALAALDAHEEGETG